MVVLGYVTAIILGIVLGCIVIWFFVEGIIIGSADMMHRHFGLFDGFYEEGRKWEDIKSARSAYNKTIGKF